eukprot:GCRY01000921.1.p1 GENE.GCRY01000921.1~~GCRY01000921.1.p1  ORF type:complete len:191 (+),score=15.78 GCRY01000921.1:604-1176(+)
MFSDDFVIDDELNKPIVVSRGDNPTLSDNWDDAQGYYSYRVGEIINFRYKVLCAMGQGVFSTVLKVKDLQKSTHEKDILYALKIIRNNETMYKAGQSEMGILKQLALGDPDDRKHCLRLISSFEYRNHLCMVTPLMHLNLREILTKFGREVGINITAVRVYAQQLLTALKHLQGCHIIHADIKPGMARTA